MSNILNPEIAEDGMDFSWIPKSLIDLRQSILYNNIVKYSSKSSSKLETDETRKITITFLSGEQLKIIYQTEESYTLFDIKNWLNSLVNYYNGDGFREYYIIDFVINYDMISNTIGISLEKISEINCIIRKKENNVMTYIECTCTNVCHIFDQWETCNIADIGKSCSLECGLLIPRGLNVFSLSDNIPKDYIIYYTDIEWFNFKKTIKIELENWNKYKNKWTYEDEHKARNRIKYKLFIGRDDYYYEHYLESILTVEQIKQRYYSRLKFCEYRCLVNHQCQCN